MRPEKKRRPSDGRGFGVRMAGMLDVPAGCLSSASLVEVIGTGETVISGCDCILEYGAESILLRVHEGCVRVAGERLEIISLLKDRITVRGRIRAVYLSAEETEG